MKGAHAVALADGEPGEVRDEGGNERGGGDARDG
jgi:hypothetical protein